MGSLPSFSLSTLWLTPPHTHTYLPPFTHTSPLQEENLAETRMALHHAENGLMFISSVVDAVMELHPSTFRQLANDIDGNPSKYVL